MIQLRPCGIVASDAALLASTSQTFSQTIQALPNQPLFSVSRVTTQSIWISSAGGSLRWRPKALPLPIESPPSQARRGRKKKKKTGAEKEPSFLSFSEEGVRALSSLGTDSASLQVQNRALIEPSKASTSWGQLHFFPSNSAYRSIIVPLIKYQFE